ncbi:type II and III secretion system protein [Rubrivirga sp.]|uniref:type II and III secretion system protein n=1 Tax=Rubrivirga sp. TaxID=1885344 RepID=UPI003C71F7D8
MTSRFHTLCRAAALLAAFAVLLVPALVPTASAQRASDGVVRGYVPPDELVSFPSSTPMNQFFRLVNPTFARVTGKRVVDPMDRTDPIGVALSGVHFIDAFEVVLDRQGLDFNESDGYFIVTEPVVIATTSDRMAADEIGASQAAAQAATAAATQAAIAQLPATADTREIRVDAVIFQLNTNRSRERGTDWRTLFGQAAAQAGGGVGGGAGAGGGVGGGAGAQNGVGAQTQFFVNAGSFFDALDGFLEASSDRVQLTTILNLFRYFETQGYGQTIATPFTVVQSGEQGQMQSGQDIPIIVRDFSGNPITEYIQTGTIINVTPTLLVDERDGPPVEFINLAVKVEKSSAGAGGSIFKDDVTTRVNLISNEMAAIGGLTSTDESVQRRGVPILRDIPLIKYLFSYRQTQVTQSEIVIVLRARVVDDLRTRMARDEPPSILNEERQDAEDRIRQFGLEPVEAVEVDEVRRDLENM